MSSAGSGRTALSRHGSGSGAVPAGRSHTFPHWCWSGLGGLVARGATACPLGCVTTSGGGAGDVAVPCAAGPVRILLLQPPCEGTCCLHRLHRQGLESLGVPGASLLVHGHGSCFLILCCTCACAGERARITGWVMAPSLATTPECPSVTFQGCGAGHPAGWFGGSSDKMC